ncbi:MAG TPA: hypothetical protein VGZ01_05420 [Trinickia sp.]|nr:hypothetical protein [Trinickia sp.]
MAVDDYHALRDAFIGSGFEVNLIDPDALLAGKGIEASTHGSGAWRFVVMLGNKPVGLITVARLQGQWQMVEAGASEMAREVMDVVSRYARVAPSARLRFIRSSQGMADFIEVIQPAEADRAIPPLYVPLFSTQAALDDGGAVDANGANTAGTSAPAPALAEAEFASDLRASVRRGMRDPRFVH